MIPGPMEHLKATAIAFATGAAVVLIMQAISQISGSKASDEPSFWERWLAH